MPRKFEDKELVIATHNPGKAKEISELLEPFVDRFFTAGELELPEPEETEETFVGNAVIKALSAAKHSGKPALADDSGLAVKALDGAPGIYSARWAGPNKDFDAAMAKVEQSLAGFEGRAAAFICVLTLAWPDGHTESFEGRVDGSLTFPPRGNRGFGYDPIFVPQGYQITFAEMEPSQKHVMSHRADAFRKLVQGCFREGDTTENLTFPAEIRK